MRTAAPLASAALLASLILTGCGKNIGGDTAPSNQQTRTPLVTPSNQSQ